MDLKSKAFIIFCLTLSVCDFSSAKGSESLLDKQQDQWLIDSHGLGLLKFPTNFREAKSLYPKATISIEKGHPGAIGSDKSRNYYFVFRESGSELFRTVCFCFPDKGGQWKWNQQSGKEFKHEDEIWMQPVTSNPKYKTKFGIGVGNTVQELRWAYRSFGRPLAFFESWDDDENHPEFEYLCIHPNRKSSTKNSYHNTLFYIKPSSNLVTAGKYNFGKFSTEKIDPQARIIAIEPNSYICQRVEH